MIYLKMIDPNDFYVISIMENEFRFQGKGTRSNVKKYGAKFGLKVSDTGYIESKRHGVEITLIPPTDDKS
jgi:hypothetical protein